LNRQNLLSYRLNKKFKGSKGSDKKGEKTPTKPKTRRKFHKQQGDIKETYKQNLLKNKT
jgi:hypothetical protein